MSTVQWNRNETLGVWEPTRYPVTDRYESMSVPSEIVKDYNRLTSFVEDKYTKEFLKVCAFYNKLFTSLKQYDWSRSSYNTVPFTLQDQERTDTGTGLSANYLKAAVDLVVSRIANVTFDYKLTADLPSALYRLYKDDIERIFKAFVKKNDINRLVLEAFHDAAILSFSHAFVDPWAGKVRKVSDWEFGCYESEFNEKRIKHIMIRDFAFPVTELDPYLGGFKDRKKIDEFLVNKQHVDLRLVIDSTIHKKYVIINSYADEGSDYPFDEVLFSTYSWDIGIRRTTVASLFDTLYPVQRQINKLLAKKTQLLAMYKGPVPVFSGTDIDVIVKQLSNGAGEILFLDTQRKPSELLTVMEPTPLDPNLNAEMESLKAQMFEMAGVQQISMDIENYRSAATVMALNQMRDAGFQSQLSMMASFVREICVMFVRYEVVAGGTSPVNGLEWAEVQKLIEEAFIDIIPIHNNDAAENVGKDPEQDPMARYINQFLVRVAKGQATLPRYDFVMEPNKLRQQAALKYIELKSLEGNEEACFNLECLLIDLFLIDVQQGYSSLSLKLMDQGQPPMDQGQPPMPEGGK